jgi:hypothetical protein
MITIKDTTNTKTLNKMGKNDLYNNEDTATKKFITSDIINTLNNGIDNNRRNVDTNDKLRNTIQIKEIDTEDDEEQYTINLNIYRYKFNEDFTNELFAFSKIHQYDDRKVFKESWTKWTEENEDIVNEEIRRLKNLGYTGNICDKMFKSARYYYRKKTTVKKEPSKRREYISTQKELLDAMDKHIDINLKNNSDYKPADGFVEFCKNNTEKLNEEIKLLYKNGLHDSIEIKNKIKKTYKNRYFLIIQSKLK